jgi:hypothetical protein
VLGIAVAMMLPIATATATATAIAAPAASAATAIRASASPPCIAKVTKIQGHPAAVSCGPATATLQIGGKTYSFNDGFCEQSKSASAALVLDLGTSVTGVKGNAGKPDFDMLIGQVHSLASVFAADYGGKDLLGGESLISVKGSIPSKGTFTSTVAVGGKFTGSWNCHGVVWQGP